MRRILHWILLPITLPIAIAFWYWMFMTGGFYDRKIWKPKNERTSR